MLTRTVIDFVILRRWLGVEGSTSDYTIKRHGRPGCCLCVMVLQDLRLDGDCQYMPARLQDRQRGADWLHHTMDVHTPQGYHGAYFIYQEWN